jgi:hypothetical protein
VTDIADEIRRAAALIRERAANGIPGSWPERAGMLALADWMLAAVDGQPTSGFPLKAARAYLNEPEPEAAKKSAGKPETEGWSRIIPPSRKSHYFVKGRSLCGRYGFPPLPLNPDDYKSPDDCAACRKKLTLRQLDQVARKLGQS